MMQNKQTNDSYYDTSLALLEQSIGHINETLIRFEKRFDRIDERMDSMENKLNSRIDSMENKLDLRIDSMEYKSEQQYNKLDSRINSMEYKSDQQYNKLDARIDSNFKWLLGMMIAGFGSLLGIVSHGFHWI